MISKFQKKSIEALEDSEDLDVWIARYCREFPTQEHSRKALLGLIGVSEDAPFYCRFCRARVDNIDVSVRAVICPSCNNKNWYTAGTFFEGIKKFRAWHALIWFEERGISISQKRFAELFKVAQSTSWKIFHAVTTVAFREMMRRNCPVVPSSEFAEVFGRRSRETPAHEHPKAEQHEAERSSASTPEDYADLADEEVKLLEVLSNDQPRCTDELLTLTRLPIGGVLANLVMLEMRGLTKCLPGERYVRTEPTRAPENPELQQSIVCFVKRYFGRISRKYLQNYLASFWCKTDRVTWKPGALMLACSRASKVTHRHILAYVTPPMVHVLGPP